MAVQKKTRTDGTKNKQQDNPKDASQKTSKKGPHGGGANYNQMAIGKGFVAIDPRSGHSQKKNIDKG